MALRARLRRAPEAAPPLPPVMAAEPADDWSPGFAPVALEERPAEDPGTWTAAAEPIDVTDHTVELPVLAPPPKGTGRRVGRAALTLALVLGCAGAAVAASGVLRSKDEMPAPVRIGGSSAIATAPRHHAKPKPKPTPVHHARRHRAHRRAQRHVAVAPAHVVAAVPVRRAPARRPTPVVHRVITHTAPAPKPAPKPTTTKPKTTTTASQPAPSAPSGEPGRQPPTNP